MHVFMQFENPLTCAVGISTFAHLKSDRKV